jgi:hypothetical protein
MPSMRYDDERATPEYIASEKKRKRIANRKAWVEQWVSRIANEMKEAREHGQEEHRSD